MNDIRNIDIRLNGMRIENFKKVKHFEFDFDSQNVNIYGTNETGKTTLFDAYSWCLFGKDSLGATEFAIKAHDKHGNEAHNIESLVELMLLVDGEVLTLKRVYKEIYTKKRGEVDATFSGHETEYYINGILKLQKDYKATIERLIPEDIFRMLNNVNYFVSLAPSKQRDIIFKMVPNVSDTSIIESSEELKPLVQYLGTMSVEDKLKVAKQDKSKINKQLEDIPVRISTLKGIKYSKIDDSYDDDQNDIEKEKLYIRQSELTSAKAKGSVSIKLEEIEEAIFSVKQSLIRAKNEKEHFVAEETKKQLISVSGLKDKLRSTESQIKTHQSDLETLKNRIESGKKTIIVTEEEKETLLTKYEEEDAREFIASACSYCGQALPGHMLDEHKSKFNLEKAQKLDNIVKSGKEKAAEIERYKAALTKFELDKNILETNMQTALERIEQLKQEIATAENQELIIDTSKHDAEIEKFQNRLDTNIKVRDKMKNESSATTIFDEELAEIKSKIQALSDRSAEYQFKLQHDQQVGLLQMDEIELRKRFEEANKIQNLCEKFIEVKAKYLEDKINDNFEIVKFKLFETQINGGIAETCVATVNGVPYPSVNNAGRINAGLDIIKSLQRIYGVKAPIWIDNAESTVKFVDLDSQVIKLYVSEEDTTLRFEVEEN